MSTEMDDLFNQWKLAKANTKSSSAIMERAMKNKKSSLMFHYANSIILGMLVVVLVVFFIFLYPPRQTLSHIGVALMISSIVVRIIIELYSSVKSRAINFSEEASKATNEAIRFFYFRKTIHGPVTIFIVFLYSLGFYMLAPEFSRYFSLPMMFLIDGSYIVGGIFLVWQIRKGIKKEMLELKKLTELQTDLQQAE